MAKRRRGAGAGPRRAMEREQRLQQEARPHEQQRLYLILDDYPFGYSIRQINLSSRQTCWKKNASTSGKGDVWRLPRPIIRLEALRGLPFTFSAIGTRIVISQSLNALDCSNPVMPIFDVRTRGVTFGPARDTFDCPIFIPIGNELFALHSNKLSKLSFEPHRPRPLDYFEGRCPPWSWDHPLPPSSPFERMDVNSYGVLPDGQTIVVSTDKTPDDPYSSSGTFTFDTGKGKWETIGDWTLPFTGRAYFVQCLGAFVGLSKCQATLGHLIACDCEEVTRSAPVGKLSNENLFSKDPDETHASARLVYTGSRGSSEFCLVQCVSVKPSNGNADDKKNLEEPESRCCYRYRYRLTTFSLSYDDNGDLTTAGTSCVQCYEVPRATSQRFIDSGDPVAFWL